MIKNEYNDLHNSLTDKKALILGGSGGIGKAIAEELSLYGLKLQIHGRSKEKLEKLTGKLGLKASYIVSELNNITIPVDLIEAARQSDILVLSYAPFLYSSLADTSPQDWLSLTMGCLALPGILATEAAKSMSQRAYGRIIFFGGTRTDVIRAYKMNAAYASAKTGLGVLVKSLAIEYADQGVACVLLCPGFVDTEYLDTDSRAKYSFASPGHELISTKSLANLTVRLLTQDMELINGSIINIDKGLNI